MTVAGCHRVAAPEKTLIAHPHYVMSAPWQAGGHWFYPSERYDVQTTGLATIEGSAPITGLTADGEIWRSDGMMGAMQDVQLPVIVTVRNMLNGRTVRVRINDRGPARVGRLISLTPRVASLLDMQGDTPVAVTEDETTTRVLDAALGGPTLDVQAAPLAGVRAESLDGKSDSHIYGSALESKDSTVPTATEDLPQQWAQSTLGPTDIFVELGRFQSQNAARMVVQRCGGRVLHVAARDGLVWNVRSGPYITPQSADKALDQSLSCGVEGARIVIE
ncbi:septal ring lytic transglycosylase RlpA family protein [Neokomagataea anthophila]|uniref:SPOR domain-containing protein n=1 Tax=Neokomagataea anthophila TaxID=2826925 RepID=A0ABS5E6Q5_9PROT|nr:hypothetical protein [Neokomagataea anthophila]MBR0559593.1 hypothetical protein [Neokomagataea anthophila]